MPPAPHKSGGWVVPLLIVLILLVLAGGGGAVFALTRGGASTASGTPTATATTAATATSTVPSAPPGFTTFVDPAGDYSLAIPQDWSTTTTTTPSGSKEIGFTSSSLPSVALEVEYLSNVPLDGQQNTVSSAFFNNVASQSHGTVSNRQGPTSVSLAGETWSQYTGDLSLSGQTLHIVLLIAGHAGSTAFVAYLAPKNSFSSDDSQYFQPMLQSFTFLK
jgi:hypothetical protein